MGRPRRAAAPRRGRVLGGLLGLLGELLITLGLVLVLFAGWQLFWTDVVADAEMDEIVATMEQQFEGAETAPELKDVPLGDAFAIIRIPRFGLKYARPVHEGTDRETLKRGVGHYAGTVMPGEIGNFSMAGHRTTYGKPFNKIAELQQGDAIIIETAATWFVYRVTSSEIVPPNRTSVILPVPNEPSATPTEALLTMTSCHPEFSSRERYITHAVLDSTYTRAEGVPSEVLEVETE